jgi:hypothetical protein
MIGNRIELVKQNLISRQTVRNIIIKSILSIPVCEQIDNIETLYIMADEKFVHTQGNGNQDVMIKSIVVFDGIERKGKRTHLINKKIFSYHGKPIVDNLLDYLYKTYDTDKIKNIYYMGDGASWIKSITNHFKFNSDTKVLFGLDKFHFKQALHHLCQDKLLEDNLTTYVINDCKHSFIEVCDNLIISYPHRSDTITNKRNYILNNRQYIINSYTHNLKCCMESNISHNLADLFTARPKAYSISMIDKLLEHRMLYKNNYNLKLLYLNNYNKKEQIIINKEHLSFDIFDKFKTNQYHLYNNYLFNPSF